MIPCNHRRSFTLSERVCQYQGHLGLLRGANHHRQILEVEQLEPEPDHLLGLRGPTDDDIEILAGQAVVGRRLSLAWEVRAIRQIRQIRGDEAPLVPARKL